MADFDALFNIFFRHFCLFLLLTAKKAARSAHEVIGRILLDRQGFIFYNGSMKIMYKVWLDSDGKAFGEGPFQLLRGVDRTGSLHQAAIEMKMSYRKAWLMLRAMEKRLGFSLLNRRVGGVAGGGSDLTDEARDFMVKYESFHREIEESLENIYQKYFG